MIYKETVDQNISDSYTTHKKKNLPHTACKMSPSSYAILNSRLLLQLYLKVLLKIINSTKDLKFIVNDKS